MVRCIDHLDDEVERINVLRVVHFELAVRENRQADATGHDGVQEPCAVKVRSNGTSKELRARIARDVVPGLVRIPRDDAVGLHEYVEVSK